MYAKNEYTNKLRYTIDLVRVYTGGIPHLNTVIQCNTTITTYQYVPDNRLL